MHKISDSYFPNTIKIINQEVMIFLIFWYYNSFMRLNCSHNLHKSKLNWK